MAKRTNRKDANAWNAREQMQIDARIRKQRVEVKNSTNNTFNITINNTGATFNNAPMIPPLIQMPNNSVMVPPLIQMPNPSIQRLNASVQQLNQSNLVKQQRHSNPSGRNMLLDQVRDVKWKEKYQTACNLFDQHGWRGFIKG